MLSSNKWTLYKFNDTILDYDLNKYCENIEINKLKLKKHFYLSQLDNSLFSFTINEINNNYDYKINLMINIPKLEKYSSYTHG